MIRFSISLFSNHRAFLISDAMMHFFDGSFLLPILPCSGWSWGNQFLLHSQLITNTLTGTEYGWSWIYHRLPRAFMSRDTVNVRQPNKGARECEVSMFTIWKLLPQFNQLKTKIWKTRNKRAQACGRDGGGGIGGEVSVPLTFAQAIPLSRGPIHRRCYSTSFDTCFPFHLFWFHQRTKLNEVDSSASAWVSSDNVNDRHCIRFQRIWPAFMHPKTRIQRFGNRACARLAF